MITRQISLGDVARSPDARIDVRHHERSSWCLDFFLALGDCVPLSAAIDKISNGFDVPASLYADSPESADALYLSVTALTSYIARSEDCIPLSVPADASEALISRAVEDREVVVTRSGTPGIAWSPSLDEGRELPIIPAGYTMRIGPSEQFDPVYLTAILNHACWRVLTGSLAAGKDQDNLNQRSLSVIPVPALANEQQTRIADRYRAAIDAIRVYYANASSIRLVCDHILERVIGLPVDPFAEVESEVSLEVVELVAVAKSPALRIDNRWHGTRHQAVRERLRGEGAQDLGTYLTHGPEKRRQPVYIDPSSNPEAVAYPTSAIQGGRARMGLARAVEPADVSNLRLLTGDLLLAMDGVGSIGKAAVFVSDFPSTVDSHVARCRVDGDSELAHALACYLNSSWGRIQAEGAMTGATGQTALSPDDARRILVPMEVVESAAPIAKAFRKATETWSPPAVFADQEMAAFSAWLTADLQETGVLALNDEQSAVFADSDHLGGLLGRLKTPQ